LMCLAWFIMKSATVNEHVNTHLAIVYSGIYIVTAF